MVEHFLKPQKVDLSFKLKLIWEKKIFTPPPALRCFILNIKQDLRGRKGTEINVKTILQKLVIHPQGKRHLDLNFYQISETKKRRTLRVITLIFENQETNLWNQNVMKYARGLLCLQYSLQNGTFSNKRKPSYCFGLIMDILLKLKEDLDIELYI